MSVDSHLCVASPLGPLTLFAHDGALVALDWGKAPAPEETPLLREAAAQLARYFAGALKRFELPLAPAGSAFDKAVWERMRAIPFGAVLTYGELARAIAGDARAVGRVCARNPLPIIVPCHRVVGAGGRLTGYSGGAGVETKRALLKLEGALLV